MSYILFLRYQKQILRFVRTPEIIYFTISMSQQFALRRWGPLPGGPIWRIYFSIDFGLYVVLWVVIRIEFCCPGTHGVNQDSPGEMEKQHYAVFFINLLLIKIREPHSL